MNSIKNLGQLTATALLVGLFSVFASAQTGPVVNADTTSSQLEMTTNVQSSLQLNISTNVAGATVTGDNNTGLFSVSLGDVNALGQGTPATGVSKALVAGGAVYSTPVNLTPVYSGLAGQTANVSVEPGASADQDIALEGDSAGTLQGVSTPRSVFNGAASGSINTRYVGFFVANNETVGLKTATLIYTVTLNLD